MYPADSASYKIWSATAGLCLIDHLSNYPSSRSNIGMARHVLLGPAELAKAHVSTSERGMAWLALLPGPA